MGLFDTHAHLYDKAFDRDRDEVIQRLRKTLDYVVIPSEDLATSRKSLALAEKYDFLYCAVGIHPQETGEASEEILKEIGDLAQSSPKVKAIGEIGLDYHYLYSDKETQKTWFGRQIELAKDLDLPFLIHDREAHGDTLSILKEHRGSAMRGILHCYSGSVEDAKTLIKLGWHLSFTGTITFKNARKAPEVIAAVPLDRIMVETDAPYMAPTPYRGKRCDSRYVYRMAETIAQIKGLTTQEVEEATTENGKRLFGIEG